MAKHNEVGRRGEALAEDYLRERGWRILARNWRCGRAEVDIIAKEEEILVFVEVKTRRSATAGPPEATVSARKMRLLARAASMYMEQEGHDWEIRFDVISVLLPKGSPPAITHLRDAFFPGL